MDVFHPTPEIPVEGWEIWDTEHGRLILHCESEEGARTFIHQTIEAVSAAGICHWALVKVTGSGEQAKARIVEMWADDRAGGE